MPWGSPRPYFWFSSDVSAIGHTDTYASTEEKSNLMASYQCLSSSMRTVWSSHMLNTVSFRVHTIWGIHLHQDITKLFCMRQAPYSIKKGGIRVSQSLTLLMMVAAHADATMQSLTMPCTICILFGS